MVNTNEDKANSFGTLFVVATPIGNIKDITFRAVETLTNSDFIICEDTRKTLKLLNHYKIRKRLISYRDQNHNQISRKIFGLLRNGLTLSIVTDSGTPLISDPGFKLIREIREKGFKIFAIPGPSAGISALSISGISTDKFLFIGFLSRKEKARKEQIKLIKQTNCAVILYESPERILKTLENILEVVGNRKIFIGNDLTKKFEKQLYSNIKEAIEFLKDKSLKGEFTIIIEKKTNTRVD